MEPHELKRLRNIREMIKNYNRRLAELRSASEVKSPGGGNGVHTGPGDPVGRIATEMAALEEAIREAKAAAVEEERRLIAYIGAVEDAQVQRILWHRYVEGCSWAAVAYRMGGRNTPDGVRMAHSRWLQQEKARRNRAIT